MELAISNAPFGKPIYAYFPDIDDYRLVVRYGLPTGVDIWSGDTGLILTPNGPSHFRIVHEPSGLH